MKKKIELWCEGYVATGQSAEAFMCGVFEAEDLKDAAQQYKDSLEDQYAKDCVDVEKMTNWGCRFFDDRWKAQKSFG